MRRRRDTGREPSPSELAEAKRIAAMPAEVQQSHPSAIPADRARLAHINTYGSLPYYYIDRPMHRALLLCMVSCLASAAADAQSLPTPPARVRMATPELTRTPATGTLLAVRGDTMLVRLDDSADTTALALSNLTKLELSAGRRRPIARGLGIGFLAGAAVGAFAGAVSGSDREGFISLSAEEKAAVGAAFFGGVGALAGGILGATRRVERWERVSLAAARPALGPLPDGRGVEIAIVVRF